jgi:hypothetical protein
MTPFIPAEPWCGPGTVRVFQPWVGWHWPWGWVTGWQSLGCLY